MFKKDTVGGKENLINNKNRIFEHTSNTKYIIMNVEEYIKYWTEQGIEMDKLPLQYAHTIPLPMDLLEFLSVVGLPKEAAPYLKFQLSAFPAFVSVDDLYDLERPDLSDYLVIGENENGDPLVLQPMNGFQVACVKVDEDFEEVFINSSLDKLSIFMYIYDQFVQRFADEDSDGLKFTDQDWEFIVKQLKDLDAVAVEEGTFWHFYLEYLQLENRNS